jgi:hypothetical protein
MRTTPIALTLGMLILSGSVAAAKSPALTDLKVYPPDVNLGTHRDRQSIVVQATFADGTTRDVTADASYSFGDKKLVKFENHTVHPQADGQTVLKIKYSGQSLVVPVKVERAQEERTISFKLDVMPIFMKAGCNSGGCHGAARGKDGFMLSLFGYDPEGDYFRITRENIGRRINLAVPEDSLMLTKSVAHAQHTGGELFSKDSEEYATILRWLKAGAPKDDDKVAHVTGIEVYPKQAVLLGSGAQQRLTVRASYSDGTDRDITRLAAFITNNDVAVKVDKNGLLTADARGEAFILARFETFAVGVPVIVVPRDLQFQFPEVAANNYIDEHVYNKLKKLRMAPSELSDDATFLRRIYIDMIGVLPSPKEVADFEADLSTGKRDRVVDELLRRPEFADMWVMKWGELLRVRSNNSGGRDYFSYKNTYLYNQWLKDQVVQNKPVNAMVKDILTASGSTFDNPPANYYKIEDNTLKMAEDAAQVFMGIRTQCAQCHNHPFDRWTMNDYYSFAAFFSQVGRKRGDDYRDTIVYNRGGGEVQHIVTKKNATPKFLGGPEPEIKPGQDRRTVLAEWLASEENPYFARNIVNIVWAHFFGRGIIDPVDDVRISNPPSNPELLEALAAKFTEYNYDFKRLVRDIATARVYQLSTKANESNADDLANFARGSIRRMRAEVLLDSINQVTDTQDKYRGMPAGARTVQIADGNVSTYFLTTFGRAQRDTVCSCEVVMEPSLSQALHLLNGDTVNNKVQQGNVVGKLLKDGKKPDEVIDELYLRCLARKPTDTERGKLNEFLKDAKEPKDVEIVLNDLFWSLLNSKEFMFNH